MDSLWIPSGFIMFQVSLLNGFTMDSIWLHLETIMGIFKMDSEKPLEIAGKMIGLLKKRRIFRGGAPLRNPPLSSWRRTGNIVLDHGWVIFQPCLIFLAGRMESELIVRELYGASG